MPQCVPSQVSQLQQQPQQAESSMQILRVGRVLGLHLEGVRAQMAFKSCRAFFCFLLGLHLEGVRAQMAI